MSPCGNIPAQGESPLLCCLGTGVAMHEDTDGTARDSPRPGTKDGHADGLAARFGALVRGRREAMGLRQEDVAFATGYGRRFIIELEAGKASCQLGKALAVAAAVGLRPLDLLRRDRRRRRAAAARLGAAAWLRFPSFTKAAGRADRAAPGGASFAYDPGLARIPNAFPISIRMPLAAGRTPPGAFERWAAGLLPEGPQLAAMTRHLGLAANDAIGILAKAGRDTPGALSIGEPGAQDRGGSTPVADEAALEQLLEDLPQRPLLAGQDGVAMTLAGSSAKLPVTLDGALDDTLDAVGRIVIPHGGAPSTHILKPGSRQLFGGVQNEALCLVLARRCGLDAPAVTTGKAGSRSYLLVQRYDRAARDGGWRRLHQETFAQALGKPAGEPPTLAEVLTLTRNVMCAPDVLGLIDYLIFNVLLCNPAADACNFSLLLSADGARLAPFHGATCLAKWDGASPKLGRMIAGEHIDWPQWKAFAAECGLNPARLIARVEKLAGAVLAQVHEAAAMVAAMPAGPHLLLPHLVRGHRGARAAASVDRRALRRLLSAPARRQGNHAVGAKPWHHGASSSWRGWVTGVQSSILRRVRSGSRYANTLGVRSGMP